MDNPGSMARVSFCGVSQTGRDFPTFAEQLDLARGNCVEMARAKNKSETWPTAIYVWEKWCR